MPRGFANYIRFTGAGLPQAVLAMSLNAARFLGLDGEFGRGVAIFPAPFSPAGAIYI